MSGDRPARPSRTVQGVIVVAVVLGILAISIVLVLTSGSLTRHDTGGTTRGTILATTTTKATILNTTTSDAISGHDVGLRLEGELSAESSFGVVTIKLDVLNTLSVVNNVTARDMWPYSEARLNYPCGNWGQFPIAYAIFQGNYGTNNYTSAVALILYDTSTSYSCPTVAPPIVSYQFSPQSEHAQSFFSSHQPAYTEDFSINTRASGYWSGGLDTGIPASFHLFPRGAYTVMIEDEWGDLLLLHFTASSP